MPLRQIEGRKKGVRKVKDIEVNQLWIQDYVGKGLIRVSKVDGKINLADALTKPVESEALQFHIRGTNACVYDGVNEDMLGIVGKVNCIRGEVTDRLNNGSSIESSNCKGIDRNFSVYEAVMKHCEELIAHNFGSSTHTEYIHNYKRTHDTHMEDIITRSHFCSRCMS